MAELRESSNFDIFDIGAVRRQVQDVDVRLVAAERRSQRLHDRIEISRRNVRQLELNEARLAGRFAKFGVKMVAAEFITNAASESIGDAAPGVQRFVNVGINSGMAAVAGGGTAALFGLVILLTNEARNMQKEYRETLKKMSERLTSEREQRQQLAQELNDKIKQQAADLRASVFQKTVIEREKLTEDMLHEMAGFLPQE